MPKEVDSCVQELLSKEDFYPDKSSEERESAAWAICNKRHSTEGQVTFDMVDGSPEITIQSSEEDGTILIFKNAVLCREAVNANGDDIGPGEIENLASTISGKPIDKEHERYDIRGVFTSGRRLDRDGVPALSVDGIIWADRYPEDANDVRSGRLKLSIEGTAERASCSICNEIFMRASNYCDHLRNKKASGAIRRLHGLKADGGALTYSPAERRAGFDVAQIRMVASHDESEFAAASSKDKELEMPELKEQLDEMTAQLEAANSEKDVLANRVSELEAQLETERVANASLVEEFENKLTAAEAESAKNLEQVRKARLAGSLTDEEWEAQKATIMTMSDEAFELVASLGERKPRKEHPAQDFHDVSGGDTDLDKKVKLVL